MPTMRTTARKRVGNGQLFRRLFGTVPQVVRISWISFQLFIVRLIYKYDLCKVRNKKRIFGRQTSLTLRSLPGMINYFWVVINIT